MFVSTGNFARTLPPPEARRLFVLLLWSCDQRSWYPDVSAIGSRGFYRLRMGFKGQEADVVTFVVSLYSNKESNIFSSTFSKASSSSERYYICSITAPLNGLE